MSSLLVQGSLYGTKSIDVSLNMIKRKLLTTVYHADGDGSPTPEPQCLHQSNSYNEHRWLSPPALLPVNCDHFDRELSPKDVILGRGVVKKKKHK